MTDAQAHVNSLLEYVPYIILDSEAKLIKLGIKDFIFNKITRKRFRRQRLYLETAKETIGKIERHLEKREPINFSILFGGYKHYWNPSYPEVDWAELFTLKFLAEWVSPIVVAYKPGVVIDFISEDLVITKMNNYPEEAFEKYSESFRTLLEVYGKSLPENLRINYFKEREVFDKDECLTAMETEVLAGRERWVRLSAEEKEAELKRSKRSIMWRGNDDWTKLSEEEKQRKIVESRITELAFYEVELRPEFLGKYFEEKDPIDLCFSFGLSPDNTGHWLTLASTYSSTVDFFIGRGILEDNGSRLVNRIVSRGQYQKIEGALVSKSVKLDSISLCNFQSVESIKSGDFVNLMGFLQPAGEVVTSNDGQP